MIAVIVAGTIIIFVVIDLTGAAALEKIDVFAEMKVAEIAVVETVGTIV